MSCAFCHGGETRDTVVCGSCVQVIIQAPEETVKKAYEKVKAKGQTERTEILENYLNEKGVDEYVPNTGRIRQRVGRGRVVRKTRITHEKKRTEPPTGELD